MVTLMMAKWVGDYFNEGLYDIHINLKEVPLLGWDAPEVMKRFNASELMVKDVVCLRAIGKVGHIMEVLRSCNHNCFPIVKDPDGPYTHARVPQATFEGIIMRSQLLVMLKERFVLAACVRLSLSNKTTHRDAYWRGHRKLASLSLCALFLLLPPPLQNNAQIAWQSPNMLEMGLLMLFSCVPTRVYT